MFSNLVDVDQNVAEHFPGMQDFRNFFGGGQSHMYAVKDLVRLQGYGSGFLIRL